MAGEFEEITDPGLVARLKGKPAPKGSLTELSPEEVKRLKAPAEKPARKLTVADAVDVAKQIPSGLVTGVEGIATLPAHLSNLLSPVGEYLGQKAEELGIGQRDDQAAQNREKLRQLAAEQGGGRGIGQYLPEPETTAGKYARTAAEFVPGAVAMPGGVAANLGLGALSGAASEGAGQYAQENDPNNEFMYRAIAPLGVGGVASMAPNRAARRAASDLTPSYKDLEAGSDAARKAAAATGFTGDPTKISGGIGGIKNRLLQTYNEEELPSLIPRLTSKAAEYAPTAAKSADPMSALTGVRPGPAALKPAVELSEIDSFRKQLGRLAAEAETKTERTAARTAKEEVDAIINPNNALSGDASTAAKELAKARANEAAQFRAENAAGRALVGDLRASSAGTGRNVDNAGRQAMRTLIAPKPGGLKTEAQMAGFDAPEIKAMNELVRGDRIDNWLRQVGGNTLVSGGLGAGSAFAAYQTGNPFLLAPWMVSRMAKGASGRRLKEKERALDEMIRSRSPAGYEKMFQVTSPPRRLNATQTGGLLGLRAAGSNPLLFDDEGSD